jgi:four helix bundle protein
MYDVRSKGKVVTSSELRKRTKDFGIRIIKLYRALPPNGESQVIGKQLLRSGTSIGANYRAAGRARSKAEFSAKLGIVVEEADETVYWIELLGECRAVAPERLKELLKEAEELTAIFSAARKTARS